MTPSSLDERSPAVIVRRRLIRLNGIVQGVGFRPFVFRLAFETGLAGFVANSTEGVIIEVEGPLDLLNAFQFRLETEAPPMAKIVERYVEEIPSRGGEDFIIRASESGAPPITMISPDMAPCEDCLREMLGREDRRYGYPFINCTGCGPRYTITRRIPYDRPNTSMNLFRLCEACREEYEDPSNRRFHAQPNACPECGPRLRLTDADGHEVLTEDPIGEAARKLEEGAVVAIRGAGGFHLAVDAHREEAVTLLRRRKGRPRKPFALMAPDLESVRRYCIVSGREAEVLLGPARPIVLLKSRPDANLAPSVAPAQRYLGFMLPSTPLHHLLMRDRFDALVMTSGNFSEEPIATGNLEALTRLGTLADVFLLHDREIIQRCDDSILRVAGGQPVPLRRSRGWVPAPVTLPGPTGRKILACGGELKNTIALSRGDQVFLSQHVGNLDNPLALDFFEKSIEHLGGILEIEPEAIAHDLHPEYLSTKWALTQTEVPRIGVQHHHAHMASVMSENGIDGKAIGIILDGTGYGTDGTIWGGEVLVGDVATFDRHAWLAPVPLPGGEAAIREPWRMALSALHAAYGGDGIDRDLPPLAGRRPQIVDLILTILERRLNAPLTSGCGRLFDAVSALLGICLEVDYEAQAAIELEMAADDDERGLYEAAVKEAGSTGAMQTSPLIRAIVEEFGHGSPVGAIAARFHNTLARIFLAAARSAREDRGIDQVALSGGVFQNARFFGEMTSLLQDEGFRVLTHRHVPPNDGGLALGQIAVADARLASGGEVS